MDKATRKSSTFAEWYPEAMKVVERYAPGELGLGNALAELLTRVANGELVPSGAGGVGMGKVNRVEETMCADCLDLCATCSRRFKEPPVHGCAGCSFKCCGFCNAGSAGTGGEKAAKSAEEWAMDVRERYDPVGQEGFIRLSMKLFARELEMYRNQTHGRGSREPEKLNNAQEYAQGRLDQYLRMKNARPVNPIYWDMHEENALRDALAESSPKQND